MSHLCAQGIDVVVRQRWQHRDAEGRLQTQAARGCFARMQEERGLHDFVEFGALPRVRPLSRKHHRRPHAMGILQVWQLESRLAHVHEQDTQTRGVQEPIVPLVDGRWLPLSKHDMHPWHVVLRGCAGKQLSLIHISEPTRPY